MAKKLTGQELAEQYPDQAEKDWWYIRNRKAKGLSQAQRRGNGLCVVLRPLGTKFFGRKHKAGCKLVSSAAIVRRENATVNNSFEKGARCCGAVFPKIKIK